MGLVENGAVRASRDDGVVPLVVDLDGTLIKSDLLVESLFAKLGGSPLSIFSLFSNVTLGRARIKESLADADLSVALLPYDEKVLKLAEQALGNGRPVYIASGSNERFVRKVFEHLGKFSGWFASDSVVNLTREEKAAKLVAAFGRGGFDYIGDSADDLPTWSVCRTRFAIRVSDGVKRRLVAIDPAAEFLPSDAATISDWLRLLRVHQFSKNVLVFVPLLTSHSFTWGAILSALGAMISFSLCASAVYIINDLVDLESDRQHLTKRNRPFASGKLSPIFGALLAPFLMIAGMAVGYVVSAAFLLILICYLALTTAYTFFLKRRAIIDVVVLAILYTTRVIAGAAAINVGVSEWLLGFSIFMFMALALIKRYIELVHRKQLALDDPIGRNYQLQDLPIIGGLAAAAGFNAVTLFSLYLSSDTVRTLYRHPKLLWLICPLLLYWMSRALMVAHRGAMQSDPIVYALKDWVSRFVAILILLVLFLAI
jgi:4-hydroxybenzoate polyprenyltransferase